MHVDGTSPSGSPARVRPLDMLGWPRGRRHTIECDERAGRLRDRATTVRQRLVLRVYASADPGLELMVVVRRSGCHDGQHDDGITR